MKADIPLQPTPIQRRITRFRRGVRRMLGTPRVPDGLDDLPLRLLGRGVGTNIPALYALLLVAVITLDLRFLGTAPVLLTVVVPGALAVAGIWRLAYWLPSRVRARALPVLRRDVAQLTRNGLIAGLGLMLWVLMLYPFGSDSQRQMVQISVMLSILTGILTMPHAPQVAIRTGLMVLVPTTILFVSSNQSNALVIAALQLVSFLLVAKISVSHHSQVLRLDISRRRLFRREAAAQMLARDRLDDATIDPLTGAHNRRAILERLAARMAEPDLPPTWLALLDLDGFKVINDTYGHAAGDAVLREVSQRIAACRAVIDHGRLGGDEFALLLDGTLDPEAARAAMEALVTTLREPITDRGAVLRPSASVGLRQTARLSVSECLERADAALYKAKVQPDARVALFTPADETALQHRRRITRSFTECPLTDRLALLYQPVWDCVAERVTGFEAFARWSPDGHNWLAAGQFMSLAEATGRTDRLTEHVLAKALGECRAWEHGRTLAINLCPRDVLREGAAEWLEAIVRDHGAPPQSIIFEVTERALLADSALAARRLGQFRERGFKVALDDFGTGWSSLSGLRNLPLDCLKIDRALSLSLPRDAGMRAIAGTIVALAWQLGIDCVLEGVEEQVQADTARALGLTQLQGFLYGRPAPMSDLWPMLQAA